MFVRFIPSQSRDGWDRDPRTPPVWQTPPIHTVNGQDPFRTALRIPGSLRWCRISSIHSRVDCPMHGKNGPPHQSARLSNPGNPSVRFRKPHLDQSKVDPMRICDIQSRGIEPNLQSRTSFRTESASIKVVQYDPVLNWQAP